MKQYIRKKEAIEKRIDYLVKEKKLILGFNQYEIPGTSEYRTNLSLLSSVTKRLNEARAEWRSINTEHKNELF